MKEYIVKITSGVKVAGVVLTYVAGEHPDGELWLYCDNITKPRKLFNVFEAKQLIAEKVSKHVKDTYNITVEKI